MVATTIRPTRTRTRLSVLFAATLAIATLTTTVGAASASASTAPAIHHTNTVAGYGAGYLARQLDASGGHFDYGSPDYPDVSDTAYAVLGLHAAGVGRDEAATATTYLSTQLGAPLQGDDGTDNPGLIGYDILAAVADGRNPYRFGGHAAQNNLVARLEATEQSSGLFGTADPTYDGAFRQGIALTALRAAGVPGNNPVVVRATAWLRGQQCGNGLWTAYRADTTVACPAADPSTFTGPDTNSTGMAAQGLAAYGQFPRRTTLLNSLNAVRSADGGFGYIAAAGQPSDPDSTALAIQGLLAEGGNPGAAYPALASYQLGCSAPAENRGAFYYPGNSAPNLLATVQAVPAAAGATFPLTPSRPSNNVPVIACTSTSAATTAATTQQASYATAAAYAVHVTQAQAASTAQAGTAGPCSGTSGQLSLPAAAGSLSGT